MYLAAVFFADVLRVSTALGLMLCILSGDPYLGTAGDIDMYTYVENVLNHAIAYWQKRQACLPIVGM